MKPKTTLALYILLAFLMLVDFYLIFNVGNPNSLIRPLFPNPDFDLIVTLGVSAVIAFLSFFVFKERKVHPAVDMLQKNREHVMRLKAEGKSDREIADSFMTELENAGLASNRARSAVEKALKDME